MLSTRPLSPEALVPAANRSVSKWAWSCMSVAWNGTDLFTSGNGILSSSPLCSASDSKPGRLAGASEPSENNCVHNNYID